MVSPASRNISVTPLFAVSPPAASGTKNCRSVSLATEVVSIASIAIADIFLFLVLGKVSLSVKDEGYPTSAATGTV